MQFNLFAITSAFVGAVSFSLSLFILANSKNRLHRVWGFFNLAVSVFGLGAFLVAISTNYQSAFWSWKLAFVGIAFIASFFYHMTHEYCKLTNKKMLWFVYAHGTIFAVLTVTTDFIFHEMQYMFGEFFYYKAGLGFNILFPVWVMIVGKGFMNMYSLMMKAKGAERIQARYLFGAMLLGFSGGATTSMPSWNIPIYPAWHIFICVYATVCTYAILKHRFLNIEFVVRRAAVYAGLFVFVYGVFAIFAITGQQILRDLLGWNEWLAMMPPIILVVLVVKPLEAFLSEKTDKFLFQKKYNYRELMQLFTTEVLMIFDLEKVTQHTVEALDNIIKLESCAVILSDDEDGFKISASRGVENTNVTFAMEDPIIQHMRYSGEPLHLDVLIKRPGSSKVLIDALNKLNSRICFPITFNKEFLGILSLGAKKSGEDYTSNDIDILGSLARAEAIAVKNARSNSDLVKAKARQHLGDMADGMSHQFNNRFGTIVALLGFQEILIPEALTHVKDVSLEEQNKKLRESLELALAAIAEARDSAFRGGEIAKTLLVHTRPERIGFGVHDISKGVPLGLNLVALKHTDFKSIKVVQRIDANLPPTWSSLSIIQEILLITLDNAYDAIKTREQSQPGHEGVIEIHISHKPNERFIRMVVKDNGCGIKPADLVTVNAGVPYFTTKGSASQKSGYGAGVHTLGEYVGILGGRHRYESQYGEWTSCVIDFPVRSKPEEALAPAEQTHGQNSHR